MPLRKQPGFKPAPGREDEKARVTVEVAFVFLSRQREEVEILDSMLALIRGVEG